MQFPKNIFFGEGIPYNRVCLKGSFLNYWFFDMIDIFFLLFIPVIFSFTACGVGFISYFKLFKIPLVVHHLNYLLFFTSIVGVFLFAYFQLGILFPLYFPIVFGMILLPILGKNSPLHKYIGMVSFFLSVIQFFVFKYHGNT